MENYSSQMGNEFIHPLIKRIHGLNLNSLDQSRYVCYDHLQVLITQKIGHAAEM